MNIGRISPLSFGHMSRYWNGRIERASDINTGTVNNQVQEKAGRGVDTAILQKNNRLRIVNPNARYMCIQYESDIDKDKSAKADAKKTAKDAGIRAITEFDENGTLVTRREFVHSTDLFSSLLATYSSNQEHCAFFSPKTGSLRRLESFETNASNEYFLAEGETLDENGKTETTVSEYPWGTKHYECEYDEDGEIIQKTFYDEVENIREQTEYYANGDWRMESYATFNGRRLRPHPDIIRTYDHKTGIITEGKYRPGDIKGDIMDLNGIV